MSSTLSNELWTPEAQLKVGAFFVEVGHHHWPLPARIRLKPDTHLIALSLSPNPEQSQICYEIDGQANQFFDAGDLMFFPAEVTVRARSEGGEQRVVRCSFDSKKLPKETYKNIDWEQLKQLPSDFYLRESTIRSALLRIAQELLEPSFASEHLIEVLATGIIIDLARCIHAYNLEQDPFKGGLSSKHLRQIKQRIDANDNTMPTLSELANLCNISVRHLMRGFKKTTGTTVHNAIEEVRLKKAKHLLINSAQPLTSIAEQLGFKHPSSFTNAFRREMGISPSIFRKQMTIRSNNNQQ